MAEGGNRRILVNVKTPKDKKVIEVDEDSPIKDVSCFRKKLINVMKLLGT